MASLARRIKLDSPHLIWQAILYGLRPNLQMNVKLQHSSTIEESAAAATTAIAEAGPGASVQPTPMPDTATSQ